MAPQPDIASQDVRSYTPEAAGLDPAGIPAEPNRPFSSAITSFADMVAPRRRVIRDLYFGNALPRAPSAPEDGGKLGVGTWVMVVVAGITLGAALTLMSAGI